MKLLKPLLLFILVFTGILTTNAQDSIAPVAALSLNDSIILKIKEYKILNPEIVYRQAILESGWFKTKFFKRTNNLFGFRTRKGYMKFDNWEQSIAYYQNWQKRKMKDTTMDYYVFLKKIKYARSKVYISRLKSIRVNPNLNWSYDTLRMVEVVKDSLNVN